MMTYAEETRRKAKIQIGLIRKTAKGQKDDAQQRLIDEIEEYQIGFIIPKNFDGADPENLIKKLDLSFQYLCSTLEELGVHKPHLISTFAFYAKIQYFKKKKAQQTKHK